MAKALSLLDGLTDQGVSFCLAVGKHRLVHRQQHLILVQVDRLGRDGVPPYEGADDDAERVLGGDGLVQAFVDRASRGPALALLGHHFLFTSFAGALVGIAGRRVLLELDLLLLLNQILNLGHLHLQQVEYRHSGCLHPQLEKRLEHQKE